MKKVTKAVFPVAGLGTRFLPATKASPKEMMPIVDKPLIQYAVEEAVAAGITDMIFVTGRSKRAIEDHFDKAYELESELAQRGKTEMLAFVQNLLPKNINCIYIRQAEALGLGHAVLCAYPAVGDEPFAVLLADDLLDGDPPVMKQMVGVYDYYRSSVIGVQQVAREDTKSYGIVDSKPMADTLEQILRIVEKPKPEEAPSTLAVVGRYVLTPDVFDYLARTNPGRGDEIQLTDALAAMAKDHGLHGWLFDGERFDAGDVGGYLLANLNWARKTPRLWDLVQDYVKRHER